METTRQNKISRLLQKELSEIFLLQTKSMPGTLVSVSAVRISPDMSIARVYLSVFPSEKAEEMVKNINNNMKSIRYPAFPYVEWLLLRLLWFALFLFLMVFRIWWPAFLRLLIRS